MSELAPAPEEVQLAVFDAYGTLFDFDAVTRHSEEMLGDRRVPLADLWRRKQLEYSWLRSLAGSYADFWQVTGEALNYAMATLAIDDLALRARLMQAVLEPELFEDARPLIEALKSAGKRTAILSNGSPTMLTAAVMNTDLTGLLDAVLSVETARVYKPHPDAYAIVVERFSLALESIVFFSANGWDAAGAAAFGLRAVWVNRAGAPLAGIPASPEAEIDSLAAARDFLGLG